MRHYHIYFEPFVDKIRVNQYIGLDMMSSLNYNVHIETKPCI